MLQTAAPPITTHQSSISATPASETPCVSLITVNMVVSHATRKAGPQPRTAISRNLISNRWEQTSWENLPLSALAGTDAAQHALFFEHGCSVKNRASAHVQNSGKFSCGYARIGGDTFKERKKFWCNFRCNIAQGCLRKPLFLVQILCFRCRFWCKPSRAFC